MRRRERQENVEGVFELKDPASVSGRHILLVDDVVTTGATMTACARELLKAGDVRLSLLALGFAK
jgi:predicted amidophosphoribosyltransferase